MTTEVDNMLAGSHIYGYCAEMVQTYGGIAIVGCANGDAVVVRVSDARTITQSAKSAPVQ